MRISIIIPWLDRGDEERRRVAEHVIDHYRSLSIGEVVIGTYEDEGGPLNRSRLRNEGAKKATGDILVFCDADSLVPKDQILKAVRLAKEEPGVVLPFDHWVTFLSKENTHKILEGADFTQFVDPSRKSYLVDGKVPDDTTVGPAYVMRRSVFEDLNGFDESYVGWGEEERDFLFRADWENPLRVVPGHVFHLSYARPEPTLAFTEGTEEHRLFTANKKRFEFMKKNRPLRIAVYSIAKNEEKHVERWWRSAEAADEVVLVDTGSTDDTVPLADSLDIMVHRIYPDVFRFDWARNTALDLVPADIDICIPLDLDEVLVGDWRTPLEEAYRAGATRFSFDYTFGWNGDQPSLQFRHDKIHARHGFRWKYPAHETLEGDAMKMHVPLEIHHFQDREKPRTHYLDLLKMGYKEHHDARSTYYYARENYYVGNWELARALFVKYLSLPDAQYLQERAEACRFMSRMVWPQYREQWLLRACVEAPERRECWGELAEHYMYTGYYLGTKFAARRAVDIKSATPDNSFHLESKYWDDDYLRGLYEQGTNSGAAESDHHGAETP